MALFAMLLVELRTNQYLAHSKDRLPLYSFASDRGTLLYELFSEFSNS